MTILSQDQGLINPDASQFLSALSDRDQKFDYFRSAADAIARLFRDSDYHQYSLRIEDCAQILDFALVPGTGDGAVRLNLRGARFCRVGRCPICQWRRALIWRSRFFRIVPALLEQNVGLRFVFLTLTLKNCHLKDLRDNLNLLNSSWKRLYQRKDFPGLGYVKSLEVTRESTGRAHPHFHVLIPVLPSYFGNYYLSQKDWTCLWKDSLRINYTPVINIKAVKGQVESKNPLLLPILETLKYSIKPQDLIGGSCLQADRDWLIEFTRQIHKMRLINTGGIFKQYLKELEEEPEDLIHSGDICDVDMSDSALHIYFNNIGIISIV